MPRPGVLCGYARVAVLAAPPWRPEEDVARVWAEDGGVPPLPRPKIVQGWGECRVGPRERGATGIRWAGVRRQMTRVVGDGGQPRRMETCGAEEPYARKLRE